MQNFCILIFVYFLYIFLHSYMCIEILQAFNLKMCIAWSSLCYVFPCGKELAPDYISSWCAKHWSPWKCCPKDGGVPQESWGVQSDCTPMSCSFCIQHDRGRSLRLWLISACCWCENDIFPGKTNGVSSSSFHPAHAQSKVWG